jgi:hypothetical protein
VKDLKNKEEFMTDIIELAQPLKKNQYGQYLLKRAEQGIS